MNAYWDKRLVENGKYEDFYTVGLRGVHDSGLEATGSPEVKAKRMFVDPEPITSEEHSPCIESDSVFRCHLRSHLL